MYIYFFYKRHFRQQSYAIFLLCSLLLNEWLSVYVCTNTKDDVDVEHIDAKAFAEQLFSK